MADSDKDEEALATRGNLCSGAYAYQHFSPLYLRSNGFVWLLHPRLVTAVTCVGQRTRQVDQKTGGLDAIRV
jgi:hypothetical protein